MEWGASGGVGEPRVGATLQQPAQRVDVARVRRHRKRRAVDQTRPALLLLLLHPHAVVAAALIAARRHLHLTPLLGQGSLALGPCCQTPRAAAPRVKVVAKFGRAKCVHRHSALDQLSHQREVGLLRSHHERLATHLDCTTHALLVARLRPAYRCHLRRLERTATPHHHSVRRAIVRNRWQSREATKQREPLTSRPKATCLPSHSGDAARVRKN